MTPWKKRKAWLKLRRYQVSIDVIKGHKVHGEIARLLHRGYTRIIGARIEFYMTFKRMLRESQTRKQERQAYRYAIAAGIYKNKTGQFVKQYRDAVSANEWLTRNMRSNNERHD